MSNGMILLLLAAIGLAMLVCCIFRNTEGIKLPVDMVGLLALCDIGDTVYHTGKLPVRGLILFVLFIFLFGVAGFLKDSWENEEKTNKNKMCMINSMIFRNMFAAFLCVGLYSVFFFIFKTLTDLCVYL